MSASEVAGVPAQPAADVGAGGLAAALQAGAGILRRQIFDDAARFPDCLVAIDQRRNQPVRIDGKIFGRLLRARGDVDYLFVE
jgi:hypothetical protein